MSFSKTTSRYCTHRDNEVTNYMKLHSSSTGPAFLSHPMSSSEAFALHVFSFGLLNGHPFEVILIPDLTAVFSFHLFRKLCIGSSGCPRTHLRSSCTLASMHIDFRRHV